MPFSAFCHRTTCDVKGILLEVDTTCCPTASNFVVPLELTSDRLFAPWHELNLYNSIESLNSGIDSYEFSCSEKSIDDFVLVILRAQPDRHQKVIDSIRQHQENLISQHGGNLEDIQSLFDPSNLEPQENMLYFACLQKSEESCNKILEEKLDDEELEQLQCALENSNEKDERLYHLHMALFDLEPDTQKDWFEIGYPAKFKNKILEDEGWEIVEIKRYGTLETNTMLTNEMIVAELEGIDGQTGQVYRKKFSPNSKSETAEVRDGVKRCLRHNQLWRNQILRIFEEYLPVDDEGLSATIDIFNPSNLCLSLYQWLTRENGHQFLPIYLLKLEEQSRLISLIIGTMWPTNISPSFSNLLNEFYEGSLAQFISSLSWGGYDHRDVLISDSLGMTYTTFKYDLNTDEEIENVWKLTDLGWTAHENIDPHDGYQKYITQNENFVQDVIDCYSNHWDGIMWYSGPDDNLEFRT